MAVSRGKAHAIWQGDSDPGLCNCSISDRRKSVPGSLPPDAGLVATGVSLQRAPCSLRDLAPGRGGTRPGGRSRPKPILQDQFIAKLSKAPHKKPDQRARPSSHRNLRGSMPG